MIYESCIKNNVTDAIKNWRKVTTIRNCNSIFTFCLIPTLYRLFVFVLNVLYNKYSVGNIKSKHNFLFVF